MTISMLGLCNIKVFLPNFILPIRLFQAEDFVKSGKNSEIS